MPYRDSVGVTGDRNYAQKSINWEEEIIKCKESPYYYATTYLTINGKPFTTLLNEQEFNKYFNEVCRLNNKL
jgi:hypothetical protein